jgi:hypothetical protein
MRPGSTWRLYRQSLALLTECAITIETDGRWLLAVWQDRFLTVSEKYGTRAEALQLSNQIWAHFLEQDWVELMSTDFVEFATRD